MRCTDAAATDRHTQKSHNISNFFDQPLGVMYRPELCGAAHAGTVAVGMGQDFRAQLIVENVARHALAPLRIQPRDIRHAIDESLFNTCKY